MPGLSVAAGRPAITSPENLSEVQNPRHHLRTTESESVIQQDPGVIHVHLLLISTELRTSSPFQRILYESQSYLIVPNGEANVQTYWFFLLNHINPERRKTKFPNLIHPKLLV